MRRAGLTLCVLLMAASLYAAVQVPNVVGQTEEAATVALTSIGLQVDVAYEVGEAGVVLAQLPAPGTMVEDGATVVVTVGRDETAQEDGEALYRVVLNHVLTMFWIGTMVGMFIKLTNRS